MRRKKGILGLAVVAALALAITTAAATAGAASGGAVVAKKCKKKKCKKKKKKTVRATLSWTGAGSDDADLDLFVFDSSGRRAGNGSDAIPASKLSPDLQGPSGQETFTDLNAKRHRPFSFGVCYQVGGSVHAPFTITFVTSNGQHHTESRDPGSSFHYDFPADGVPIGSGYCPD